MSEWDVYYTRVDFSRIYTLKSKNPPGDYTRVRITQGEDCCIFSLSSVKNPLLTSVPFQMCHLWSVNVPFLWGWPLTLVSSPQDSGTGSSRSSQQSSSAPKTGGSKNYSTAYWGVNWSCLSSDGNLRGAGGVLVWRQSTPRLPKLGHQYVAGFDDNLDPSVHFLLL